MLPSTIQRTRCAETLHIYARANAGAIGYCEQNPGAEFFNTIDPFRSFAAESRMTRVDRKPSFHMRKRIDRSGWKLDDGADRMEICSAPIPVIQTAWSTLPKQIYQPSPVDDGDGPVTDKH